jgi:hypothetical protein
VDGVWVMYVSDVAVAGKLEEFAVASGFPPGWVADMLAEGAVGVLAVSHEDGSPLAMGWVTGRAFYVDEIGATLNPNGGAYLFGDFVAPGHRGRKLQRLLVAERLRGMPRGACTIVHPGNVASMRSYGHEGFATAGRFTRRWWLGRSWARCWSDGEFELEGAERIVARWGR